MKLLLLAAVLASTSVLALAADNASVSGRWNVHSNVAGNESDTVCTFTQKDADLPALASPTTARGKQLGKWMAQKSPGLTILSATARLSP